MKNAHKWGVNPNLNPDFPAVDEEHECHIAKQYLDIWGGWFGVIMAIPALCCICSRYFTRLCLKLPELLLIEIGE